jgi:hypothetical protein
MTKHKKTTAKSNSQAKTAKRTPKVRVAGKTKLAQLEAMLRRPDGATIEQMSKSLDWQMHSVRGVISGALKKKQGLTITNEKTDDGRRVYRIAT